MELNGGRHSLARSAVYATALTAALALGLAGCGSSGKKPVADAKPIATTTAPSAPAQPTTTPSSQTPTAAPPSPNGTANSKLTITEPSGQVLMNGGVAPFGGVHDLAWKPDGSKAAFLDDAGNLVVVNADGSGRTVVALNPGGEVWSHPAWQDAPTWPGVPAATMPPKDNLIFAATRGGISQLDEVVATAHSAAPKPLVVGGAQSPTGPQVPASGDIWPSGGGTDEGAILFEHMDGASGDVYYRDDNLRLTTGKRMPDATEPALAPNEFDIAFVRSVDGHRHIFEQRAAVTGMTSDGAVDLTPEARFDCTNPVWSPDGTAIAFSTTGGVDVVQAAGSHAITIVSYTPGVPAYR